MMITLLLSISKIVNKQRFKHNGGQFQKSHEEKSPIRIAFVFYLRVEKQSDAVASEAN